MNRERGRDKGAARRRTVPAAVGRSAPADAVPPSFDRIYFDSEPLVAARWPRLSAELVNVLGLARVLGIGVFLPEATERELEAQWLRQARELSSKFAAHTRDIVEPNRYTLPELDVLRVDYLEKVGAAKAQSNIQTVPLPRRTLGEIFEHWVAASIMAESKVAHLKDTAVYQSVVEHLEKEPGHSGAFVSKDGHFDPEFIRRLTPPGLRVELYGTTQLLVALQSGLNAELLRQITEDRRRAQAAMEARHDDLERFISAKLEVPEGYLSYLPRVMGFSGAKVIGIRGVLTTHLEEKQPQDRVQLSARVEVELRLLVERQFPSAPDRAVRAGEPPLVPAYVNIWQRSLAGMNLLSVPEERIERAIVLVEASAALHDGNYEDVQFVSAYLPSSILGAMFERATS